MATLTIVMHHYVFYSKEAVTAPGDTFSQFLSKSAGNGLMGGSQSASRGRFDPISLLAYSRADRPEKRVKMWRL